MSSILPQSSDQKVNATQSSQATESKAGINWKSAASSVIEYSIDVFYKIGNVVFGNPWIVPVEDQTSEAKPSVITSKESVQSNIDKQSDEMRTNLKNVLQILIRLNMSPERAVIRMSEIKIFFDQEASEEQIVSDLKFMIDHLDELYFGPAICSPQESVQARIDTLPELVRPNLKAVLQSSKEKGRSGLEVASHHPTLRGLLSYDERTSFEQVSSDYEYMMDHLDELDFGPAVRSSKESVQARINTLPEMLKPNLKAVLQSSKEKGRSGLEVASHHPTLRGMLLYDERISHEQVSNDYQFMVDHLDELNFGPTGHSSMEGIQVKLSVLDNGARPGNVMRIQRMFDRMTPQDQTEFFAMIKEIEKQGVDAYEFIVLYNSKFLSTECQLKEIIYDEYQAGTSLEQVRSDLLFILKNSKSFNFEKGRIEVKETAAVALQVKKTKKKKNVRFNDQIVVRPIEKANLGIRSSRWG
ncbi:hypothetical protein [Simkania negevensis]|uniref:Uncharacterized protein n=1 Tax=Simkania negevensis (strain ATCC VR-1471 / DSM 27360 / Z) TaxID=331113 RepID=F8L3I8_SIMNZ|nr:hypothetical protein [Simkania negevensis]CCB89847.1 unknown protein [Simkania negevensis Z]